MYSEGNRQRDAMCSSRDSTVARHPSTPKEVQFGRKLVSSRRIYDRTRGVERFPTLLDRISGISSSVATFVLRF